MPSSKRDIIKIICSGEKKQFVRIPCDYYDSSTIECNLLNNNQKLEKIFNLEVRCEPDKRLYFAVRRILKKYKNKLGRLEHRKDLNWKNDDQIFDNHVQSIALRLLERLKHESLKKGYNLYVFQAFIKICSWREVVSTLKEERIMPQFECGWCLFLSQFKPYVCEREQLIVVENGEKITKPNPYYKKKRNPSNRACKEGFRTFDFEPTHQYEDEPSEDQNDYKIKTPESLREEIDDDTLTDFAYATILLKRRMDGAKTNEAYRRQFESLLKRRELMYEYDENEDVERELATYFQVNVKTIQRDFKKIREFLRKKMSDKD